MLALVPPGRQAERCRLPAARRMLMEELGIEPGRVLRQLQRAILTADPALEPAGERTPVLAAAAPSAPVPPAQLPADVGDFTGRDRHLRQLHQLLAASRHTTAVPISAIVGGAGTGKTALAIHWAHQVRHQFDDGQLYVDLRGTTGGAGLGPMQALTHLLRGLGVAAADIPDELDQAAALYRTLLADRHSGGLTTPATPPSRPLCQATRSAFHCHSRDQLVGLSSRAPDGSRSTR